MRNTRWIINKTNIERDNYSDGDGDGDKKQQLISLIIILIQQFIDRIMNGNANGIN